LYRPVHNDGVAGVGGNAASLRQNFEKAHRPIGLVDHGMPDGADHGDGLAFSFFDGNADFGVRNQAVGFQNFGDFLFSLNFRQPSDVQANRDKGNTDGAGLADADVATEFFDIENLDFEQITIADDIVMRGQPRGGRHQAYAIVDLLWRLENGLLSAAGWRQNQ
jgi:hypothetical protein